MERQRDGMYGKTERHKDKNKERKTQGLKRESHRNKEIQRNNESQRDRKKVKEYDTNVVTKIWDDNYICLCFNNF